MGSGASKVKKATLPPPRGAVVAPTPPSEGWRDFDPKHHRSAFRVIGSPNTSAQCPMCRESGVFRVQAWDNDEDDSADEEGCRTCNVPHCSFHARHYHPTRAWEI